MARTPGGTQGALLPRGDRNRWRIRRPTAVMTDVANLQVSDALAVCIPPLLHCQNVFRHVGRQRAARSVPHLLALAINVRFAVGTGPPGGQPTIRSNLWSGRWALCRRYRATSGRYACDHCALVSVCMLPVYTCQQGNAQRPLHHEANLINKPNKPSTLNTKL